MSGQKLEALRPAEVDFTAARFVTEGSGALAVKTAIEEDVPAVPVKTPRERALGRIEHFKAVVEGKEDSFYVYFVLGLEEHEDMHRHFLEELGLPYPTVKDLSDMHEPHAVLTDGDVQLIRSSNVYEDGEAYDITYKSAPFENSY